MGESVHSITRPQGRRLISTNSKTAERFISLFMQQLNRNHVIERLNALDTKCVHFMSKGDRKEYEKLDRMYTHAFKYADKRCRKLKAGEVAYALEEIQAEGRKILLYTLCIRKRCNCKVSNKLIKRIAKSLDIVVPNNKDISELK